MKKILSIILCVCLLATTVFTMPMVSAEETTEVEYFYHANDYESLTGDEEWLSTIEQGRAMSVESGANAISGGKSLKVTSDGVGWIGAALSDAKVPAGVTARVSFDYKVTVGKKAWGGVGYIGCTKKTNSAGVANVNCYNWSNIHNGSYTEAKFDVQEALAGSGVKNVEATLARKGTGAYPVGIYYGDGSAASEVLFDNLVIAEIIKNVSAVSADEAKGTVAVANKEAKYTDYAMGETAVFTAIPAEGYAFAGWYNGDVLVSKEATYEHTLTGDTTLTAKWKLEEKEYQYVECDYENLTDTDAWFSKADGNTGVLTVSLEKESPISGSASLKLTKTTVGGNAGYGGFAVFPDATTLKSGKYYRVKANTKIQSGTFSMGRFGNIGNKGSTYNWAHIFNAAGYTGQNDNGGTPLDIWPLWHKKTAPASFTSHGILKISENTSLSRLGIAVNASALDENGEASILIDNVVAAEIIDTVAAVSSDETKGTVSVANKDGFEDYAVKEVAVFTATPAEGYSFAGWYNSEDVLVSNEATYEHTLTTDTTLTAKWKVYEKEYDYKAYDYENLTDTDAWFATANGSTMSFETEKPIGGKSSLKITATKLEYMGAAIIPIDVALKSATTYRLTASSKVIAGKFKYGRVGSASTVNGLVNHNNIGIGNHTNGSVPVHLLNSNWAELGSNMKVRTVTDKLSTANAGLSVFGGIFYVSALDENGEASIIIDDLVAAEMIDSVTATSADAAMGSATVANKAGYEDYAVKEVAVFTATPKNGYYLEGWYNANGEKVSSDKVYEVTLTTDTNLTAKFAAYENLSTIFFNTNGGNDIDAVTDGVGADFVLPEAPVKAGYTFVGWYTNVDCTTPFTATTFPAEDITIHAKWIVGSYIDFENYQTTPSGNITVMNDGENAYSGNGYLKYSATAKDGGSRIVLTDGKAIKDFALAGDKIEISFKYKLVSGNARFYMHTSSQPDRVVLTDRREEGADNAFYLNAYEYKNTTITAVSEDWQTLTAVLDLKSLDKAATERTTFEDYLYSVLYLISDNETGVELYIDDVTLTLVPGEHVKTAYNNAAALRSAAASSTGKNGLRVYNQVDTQWVESKNIVEYGSVAAFASNIDGEINIENGIKGISYSDGTLSPEKSTIWDVKEGAVIYTAYITNIPASRYSEDILIRSYAIAEDGTVYYGKTVNVSVFEVANAIDNANTADGSEQTEADAAAFYLFVTEGNANAYAAWCAENGKAVGTLYNNKYAA